MRSVPFLALTLALAGPAAAQPITSGAPTRTVQCIEAGGHAIPPDCHAPASRIDKSEYICTCINGGQSVDVAICGKGQTPPPEGKALNAARRDAVRDGSLIGDTFEGKPICVAPRQS